MTTTAASTQSPTTGLAWASRLLFEGEGVSVRMPRQETAASGAPRPVLDSYLVLPNPRSARLLIPLGSPAAAAGALRRWSPDSSATRRLARRGLALGLRTGLGRHVGRRLDVVADPPAEGVPPAPPLLRNHLRRVLGRPDLELAVMLGPPRLNRKPVLQLLDGHGEVIGFAKAAWNDLTRRLVRNEAATLAALAGTDLSTFVAPRLLHHGPWGDVELVVTSPLPGPARPPRPGFAEPPLATLGEIARRCGVVVEPLAGSRYWRGLRARLAEPVAAGDRPDAPPAPGGGPDLLTAAAGVEARFGATPLRFGAWHGDFTPWNLSPSRRPLPVWDWERAADPVPLGLDLAHFVFQQAVRQPRRDPERAIDWSRRRVRVLLEDADLDPGGDDVLWLLYGLELLARYDGARRAGALARPSAVHAAVLRLLTSSME